MLLKEKIQQDIYSATKDKKELEVSVLRQLSAAILNKEKDKKFKLSKENKTEQDFILTDEEVIDVISFEAKKRRESILEFEKAGRNELADKEKKELEILLKYLPEQISEEDIKGLAKQAVDKLKAVSIKDMGKVMAELAPKVKGRSDGAIVSKIVKELLGC